MEQENNPLHGVKLKEILEFLVDKYGWEELAQMSNFRCFFYDPSMNSALKFLRSTPWARDRIEKMYLRELRWMKNNSD